MKIQLGETIRNLRKKRGLTQSELAERFSVAPQSVSRWENGQSYPDIEQLPMIADYFNITVDELMGRDGKTKEKLDDELKKLRTNSGDDMEAALKMREILAKLVKNYPVGYSGEFFRVSMLLQSKGFLGEKEVEEAREYCRIALRECTDDERPTLLTTIVLHEDEAMTAQWKHYITSDVTRATWNDILLTRYFAVRDENHLWEGQMRKVLYDHIHAAVWTMANDKAGECQKKNSFVYGFLHTEEHYRKILALIALFDDGKDEKFLAEQIFVKIHLMAVLIEKGKIDEGAALIPELQDHLRLLLKKSQGQGVNSARTILFTEQRNEFDPIREDSRFAEFFTFVNSVSNPKARSEMHPADDSEADFDITDWVPLLETAGKKADEVRSECDLTKYPTVVALKSATGKIYCTVVDDLNDNSKEKALLAELTEKCDTHIDKIVCMSVDSGAVDMFRIAAEIARLDRKNSSAEILLHGAGQYHKRTLCQVYGEKVFS